MQYRVPKKVKTVLLLIAVSASAGCSLLVMAAMGIAIPSLLVSASLFFFAFDAYLMMRFVLFDCAYRLGEEYSDFSVSFYYLTKKGSRFIKTVEFSGKEELLPWDKNGRKAIKNRKKRLHMTSNLIPDKAYVLLFEDNGEKVYALLELQQAFAHALRQKIALAGRFYGMIH